MGFIDLNTKLNKRLIKHILIYYLASLKSLKHRMFKGIFEFLQSSAYTYKKLPVHANLAPRTH